LVHKLASAKVKKNKWILELTTLVPCP
jgi:hypothetical protein